MQPPWLRPAICAGLGVLAASGLMPGIATPALAVSLPTAGVCGFAIVLRRPFAYLDGSHPPSGAQLNVLGTINFATGAITGNVVSQSPGSTIAATTESQSTFSVPFTKSTGRVTGSTTIKFTPISYQWSLNLTPLIDGLTILMQVYIPAAGHQDAGGSGVCRMQ